MQYDVAAAAGDTGLENSTLETWGVGVTTEWPPSKEDIGRLGNAQAECQVR